jgi:hypothetical protein
VSGIDPQQLLIADDPFCPFCPFSRLVRCDNDVSARVRDLRPW